MRYGSCVCCSGVIDWMLIVVAFGRNLCIDGGYEICAEMYNKNILVPLQTFVPKVRRRWFLIAFMHDCC